MHKKLIQNHLFHYFYYTFDRNSTYIAKFMGTDIYSILRPSVITHVVIVIFYAYEYTQEQKIVGFS